MFTELLVPQQRYLTRDIAVTTSDVTLHYSDRRVVVNLSTDDVTITLASARECVGSIISFYVETVNAHTVTIAAAGEDMIRKPVDAMGDIVLIAIGDWAVLRSDGIEWMTLGARITT